MNAEFHALAELPVKRFVIILLLSGLGEHFKVLLCEILFGHTQHLVLLQGFTEDAQGRKSQRSTEQGWLRSVQNRWGSEGPRSKLEEPRQRVGRCVLWCGYGSTSANRGIVGILGNGHQQ